MPPATPLRPPPQFAHRIHLPIVTHPNVSFEVCPNEDGRKLGRRMSQAHSAAAEHDCVSIPMAEGMVFEVGSAPWGHTMQRRTSTGT